MTLPTFAAATAALQEYRRATFAALTALAVRTAMERGRVTADDLRIPEVVTDRRVAGAVLAAAVRRGLLVAGEYTKTAARSSHGRPIINFYPTEHGAAFASTLPPPPTTADLTTTTGGQLMLDFEETAR